MRNEQQEQNAYAQNAVKRVRARLEGKTEDSKVLSVTDQVCLQQYSHMKLLI